MSDLQKKLLLLIVAMGGLVAILAIGIWWQKKSLNNIKPDTQTTYQQDQTKTKEPVVNVNETKPLTPSQEKVKSIIPESDLDEFNLSDKIIDKDFLYNKYLSPAFNRSGTIKTISPADSSFIFVDDSLGKEKEYKVIVDNNTKIYIKYIEYIYPDAEAEEPIGENIKNREAQLSELQPGDTINIRSREIINSGKFLAEEIRVKRNLVIYQK